MRTTKITMLAVAVLLMAINACKKEESTTTTPTPTPTPVDVIPSAYKKIGETYVIGASAKAVIYADKELFVGYNKLYVAMYDSATNSRLDDGHFDIEPMMDMGTMQHGSPFEVEEIAKPTDKFWKAQVVFTMASTSSASWMLHLHFHNHKNDLEGEGELKVEVKSPTVPVVKSIVAKADNNANLFVSLVSLTKPVEGLNNFDTGRLAIMEICLMTEHLQEKINLRATAMELKAQALKDGMIPMRYYGFRKASEGITTLEEVMTVTAASE